jgi:Ca2+-binding EF-hand superfamily protein
MRLWTRLFILVLGCLVVANAFAQRNTTNKNPLLVVFQKMDANHDGILTVQEFVAANSQMGEAKATAVYKELVNLGGVVTKGNATGMAFPQFAKAYVAWVQARSNQGQK